MRARLARRFAPAIARPGGDGRPAGRKVMPLSRRLEHRVVTRGEAARVVAAVTDDLERRDTVVAPCSGRLAFMRARM